VAGPDPYRAPHAPDSSENTASLTLRSRTAETQGLGTRPVLGLIAIVIMLAVVLHYLAMVVEISTLVVGLLVLLVAVAVNQVMRVSRSRRVSLVLRGGYVNVRVGREPPRVIVASDVREITLEHPSEPGGYAIVGHGVRETGEGPSRGRARLVIRLVDGQEVRMPGMPIAHTEIVEWLSDVRRFMRTAGFVEDRDPALDDETPIASLDEAARE